MSGTFDIAADASINMTAGSAGAVGSGAYTLAALFRPTVGNNNSGILWCDASGSHQRSFFEDSLNLFGFNDFSTGFASLTQGNWYVVAQSKAAGSNLYRFHIWAYASDGSGTMTHGTEGGGPANQGDGSTIDAIRIGIAEDRGNSLIAAVGLWTSALSDGQLDTLKSGSLSAWSALSPAELISLENWNGSTGCTAVIGTSSQSSITGTVGTGANPPGFSFSLTSASAGPGDTYAFAAPPGLGIPFGELTPWLGVFPAADLTAAAENAAATGSAANAAIDIQVNAESTSATGSAASAAADVQANAGGSAATGSASDAATDIQANAQAATATGAAGDASADIRVNAEATAATGAAFDATVSTSSNTNAPAEATSATGSAGDASAAIAANAEAASATGAAQDPQAAIAAPAGQSAGTGAAGDPAGAVQPDAGQASATGAAFDAVIVLAVNTEVATAVGAANAPTVSVGGPGNANAEVATASGTAYNARTHRAIPRPASGTTARPGSGTTPRPFSGITERP